MEIVSGPPGLGRVHYIAPPAGRVAGEMALARSDGERFYSLTARIGRDSEAYYDILEATQTGGLDVTGWQGWFLDCLARACANARHPGVLARARLGETHALNPRQARTLDRLLDGTEGSLTSSGWAAMNLCSQDTANRDIRDLVERGILARGEARWAEHELWAGWGVVGVMGAAGVPRYGPSGFLGMRRQNRNPHPE